MVSLNVRAFYMHAILHFIMISFTKSYLNIVPSHSIRHLDMSVRLNELPTDEIDDRRVITFVSSNQNKISEAQMILGSDFPWRLEILNVDLVEPQATPIEVSRTKCKQAVGLCKGPVIVEDTSLCFNALNGLPGPYVKWFYEGIGNEGLAKLLDGFEDKTAYAQCVLSYCAGEGHEVRTFVGSSDGTIIYPTGPEGFGWDPIFQPAGYNLTFAQMDKPLKNKLSHRFKAFREFKAYVNRRSGS